MLKTMPKLKARQLGKLDGFGEIYSVGPSNLDEQIAAFQAVGIEHPYFATPEEVAGIWTQKVSKHDWSRLSTCTVGMAGEKPILYKHSPLMNPAIAKFMSDGEDAGFALDSQFYTTLEKIAEREAKLPVERKTAQVLGTNKTYRLTYEMEEGQFLFGRFAKDFLNANPVYIHSPLDNHLPEKRLCVAWPMWISSPRDDGVAHIGFGLDAWPGREQNINEALGILRKHN